MTLRPNGGEHVVDPFHHVPAPEADHPIALGLEPAGAPPIEGPLLGLGVPAAVDLHDRSLLETDEIDDERSERMLALSARHSLRSGSLIEVGRFRARALAMTGA